MAFDDLVPLRGVPTLPETVDCPDGKFMVLNPIRCCCTDARTVMSSPATFDVFGGDFRARLEYFGRRRRYVSRLMARGRIRRRTRDLSRLYDLYLFALTIGIGENYDTILKGASPVLPRPLFLFCDICDQLDSFFER